MELGVIIALMGGVATAVAACITAWKTAPTVKWKQVLQRLDTLEDQVSARDETIDELGTWQLAARGYIFTLSNRLADAGFDVPTPPEALHIEHRKGQ